MTYYYRGDPARTPGSRHFQGPPERRQPPADLQGSPRKRAEEKAERYERFCRHRDDGMGVFAAGAQVGIKARAARRYEKQRQDEAEARAS